MYHYKTKIISAIFVFGLLAGCSSSPDDEDLGLIPDKSAQGLYEDAKESLRTAAYGRAIQQLSALNSRFPFGPLAHQSQLDLIYAHYKVGNINEALAMIDRFITLNPTQADLDYVYYMRGLANLASESNLLQDSVGIDRSDRDPTATRQAFNDFKTVLENYPNSKYAADARKRMIAIKNKLAKYELLVASYYMKRGAYVAAANRARYVIEYYSTSPYVEQALELLVECYNQLGLKDLEEDTKVVLKLNFPNNRKAQ